MTTTTTGLSYAQRDDVAGSVTAMDVAGKTARRAET
jgi:hypothetical protein